MTQFGGTRPLRSISAKRVRVNFSLVLIYGTQARRTNGESGLYTFAVSGLLVEMCGRASGLDE